MKWLKRRAEKGPHATDAFGNHENWDTNEPANEDLIADVAASPEEVTYTITGPDGKHDVRVTVRVGIEPGSETVEGTYDTTVSFEHAWLDTKPLTDATMLARYVDPWWDLISDAAQQAAYESEPD